MRISDWSSDVCSSDLVREFGKDAGMAVYTVAQVKINDGERYEKYRERFGAVLQQYDGRLVAADDNPVVQEGQWSYEKIVILEFADQIGRASCRERVCQYV